jgi:hypothetical protein
VTVSACLVPLEPKGQEQLYTITALEYSKYGQSMQQPLRVWLDIQNAFSHDEFLMRKAKIVRASNEIHSLLQGF